MSPQELWRGAELAARNARSLLGLGNSASSSRRYGAASALCILSFEESAKSFALVSEAIEFREMPYQLPRFFRNHKIKHETGIAMYLTVRVLFYVVGLARQLGKMKEATERNALMEQAKAKLQADMSKWMNYAEKLVSWVEEADKNKQKGLYVGREDELWISPEVITSEEFQRNRRMARDLVWVLERLFKESNLETARAAYRETLRMKGG